MVAIDSTSYPCLAVIEHYNTDPELTYAAGRKMLEFLAYGGNYPNYDLPLEAHFRLASNYRRAAEQFGWGIVR